MDHYSVERRLVGHVEDTETPTPSDKNSKASILSLWASRQSANLSSNVGNISGGTKNFGSTSTNTRITLYLLLSFVHPLA
jgi:hypothetical protein